MSIDPTSNSHIVLNVRIDDETYNTNNPKPAKAGRVELEVDIDVKVHEHSPDLAEPTVEVDVDVLVQWKGKIKPGDNEKDDSSFNVAGMTNPMVLLLIAMIEMASKIKIIDAKLGGQFAQIEFHATQNAAEAKRTEGAWMMAASIAQGIVGMAFGVKGGTMKLKGLDMEKGTLTIEMKTVGSGSGVDNFGSKNGKDVKGNKWSGDGDTVNFEAKKLQIKGDMLSNLSVPIGALVSGILNYQGSLAGADAMVYQADAEMWGRVLQEITEGGKNVGDFVQTLYSAAAKLIDGSGETGSFVASKIC